MSIWSTENPAGVTLDQGIGRVTPRGSKQVTPSRTTTYTLTVRGPNNTTLTKTVTLTIPGTTEAASVAPAEPVKKEVPMIAGHPDLSPVREVDEGHASAERVDAVVLEMHR